MPTVPLPQDPDLGQLRTQARELQRAVRSGDPDALALVTEFHPRPPAAAGAASPPGTFKPGAFKPGAFNLSAFPLSAAQLVLARRYDFPSWARLARYVRIVTARAWTPGQPPPEHEPLADTFLRLACLTYSNDDAADRDAAARLLAEHPELPATSPLVAAACADVEQVRRFLAADPSLAAAAGGPHGWSPLLYQAYARHDRAIGLTETLQTARLLLDSGADPNDGRFWHGLPTPFTALTGVLGSGEQDQPWHPHAIEFARVLLAAGADPNDGQTLYNRMFGDNDDHLILLFAFGLGRDTGGPWHRLLGDALESPAVRLRNLLGWALEHDQRDRVALLAEHGVDIVSPLTELRGRQYGRCTPVEYALLNGHRELADQLLTLGAQPPQLGPVDAFVAAALAADADAVRAASPEVVAAARQDRSGLVTWAASQGAPGAVELLAAAGFDVNAYGRSDIPSNQPWHTALHVAAEHGNLSLAQTLLALGADPDLPDKHYNGTPLGWARHFNREPLIDLLEPLTAGPAE